MSTGHQRYTSTSWAMVRFFAQRALMKPLIWSLLNVHVHGKRNLAGMSGPYIAVANHSSHLDGPLVMSSLPPRLTRYLATGAAADYFFTSPTKALAPVLFMNAFPVDRGGGRSRHKGLSGNLLTEGVPILLFPEGTRSRTGAMKAFKPGPAALCISRNVPVIPIAIVGAHRAMPTDSALPKSGRPDVHLVFGKPMWAAKGETARKFADRMHEQVLRMHDSMAKATGFPTMAEYAAEAERQKTADLEADQRKTALEGRPRTGTSHSDEPTNDEPTNDEPGDDSRDGKDRREPEGKDDA